MVMDIQADRVGCIIFGRYDHVDSYSRVRRLNKMASVPVGEAMLVREAARKQQEGLTIEELAAWVEENRLKI